jgi:AcrR family transcriptional regulator
MEAASRLFADAGYENVSMRRIAEAVGCSQMAAYRHFPDKSALIQRLCIDLYERFTPLQTTSEPEPDPRQGLKRAMGDFLRMSVDYPHHYKLAFLTPPIDAQAQELRVKITKPITAHFRHRIRLVLSPDASDEVAEERLHQLMACLHGMAVMLITHPLAYGLNMEKALAELESAFDRILAL